MRELSVLTFVFSSVSVHCRGGVLESGPVIWSQTHHRHHHHLYTIPFPAAFEIPCFTVLIITVVYVPVCILELVR